MRLLKDGMIYLMGELIAKSLPFLMLPYLTRKLGPEGFGELSFYLTMLTLFGIVIGLSQEGAITRYFYFYGKRGLSTIIKVGYLYSIVITIMALIGCWFFKSEILTYLVLATAFQSFINVQLSAQQCQKKPWPYIGIQLLVSLTNVIFTVLALETFNENQVINRILAITLANMVSFIIILICNKNNMHIIQKISFSNLKIYSMYIISFGLPLILHQSSFFIKGQLDRIFIYNKFSTEELGIYSAGMQIASVLPIIFMAANKAIVPYYYQYLKENKLNSTKIKQYALYSIPICIIPSIIAWFMPNQIFTFILGEQFNGSKFFTIAYLLGFGITLPYLILVNYFFYHGKNSLISAASIISAVSYIGLLLIMTQYDLKLIPMALIFSNLILIIILWKKISHF